jgi:hypothetical protein
MLRSGARNVIWNNDFESQTFYKGGSAVALSAENAGLDLSV